MQKYNVKENCDSRESYFNDSWKPVCKSFKRMVSPHNSSFQDAWCLREVAVGIIQRPQQGQVRVFLQVDSGKMDIRCWADKRQGSVRWASLLVHIHTCQQKLPYQSKHTTGAFALNFNDHVPSLTRTRFYRKREKVKDEQHSFPLLTHRKSRMNLCVCEIMVDGFCLFLRLHPPLPLFLLFPSLSNTEPSSLLIGSQKPKQAAQRFSWAFLSH